MHVSAVAAVIRLVYWLESLKDKYRQALWLVSLKDKYRQNFMA